MVLEFSEHQYIDMENVQALRWMDDQGLGIIFLNGDKLGIQNRAHFDIIERAFIYKCKSYMVDDKIKKIRWVKGGK